LSSYVELNKTKCYFNNLCLIYLFIKIFPESEILILYIDKIDIEKEIH